MDAVVGTDSVEFVRIIASAPWMNTLFGALGGAIPSIILLVMQNRHNLRIAKGEQEFRESIMHEEWRNKSSEEARGKTYSEKKDAYINMMSALKSCDEESCDNLSTLFNSTNALHIVKLVGSNNVCIQAELAESSARRYIMETRKIGKLADDEYKEFIKNRNNMVMEMRNDLGRWLHQNDGIISN